MKKSYQPVFFGVMAAVVLLLAGFSATPTYAQSIVVNGEFESGNSGFSSDYEYVSDPVTIPPGHALWVEGQYAVGTNPRDWHSNFYNMGDHATGSGQMMIVNGDYNTELRVWEGTVNVDLVIGNTYVFSAWVCGVSDASIPAPASLTFMADGVTIGTLTASTSGWSRLFGTFTAASLRPTLTMMNSQSALSGNDFALDDISVRLTTTTTLTSSPDPSGLGATVTLAATVSPSAATGTVEFYDGATYLGADPLNSGVATLYISSLTAGVHTLTAYYLGDSNYDPSSDTDPHEVIPQEIDVQRPTGTSIPDGGTDNIGIQRVGAVDLTYTIANTESGTLTVSGATADNYVNCSGFTLSTTMPLNIVGTGTSPFDISFTITDDGPFSFIMHIASNDGDENPYDITVSGIGVSKDYGDAPLPFPTLLVNNGARHTVDDRLKLGSLITLEVDGQPSANADADAGDDGVTNPVYYKGETANVAVSVANTTGNQAYLNAWIDWDGNGGWAPEEQIATNLAVNAGANTLNVNVPYEAIIAESNCNYGLYRLSTQQNLTPTGLTSDGEAETFKVTIDSVEITVALEGVYMGGKTVEIQWATNPTAISTVTLKYSTDNGATYPNVIVAGTENDGSYFWTLPLINSVYVKVKAEVDGWEAGRAAAEDYTPDNLPDGRTNCICIDSTPPTVNLISPLCQDTFFAGDTMTVRWQASDNLPLSWNPYPISLQYSLDNWTGSYIPIAENIVNSGEYKWRIPVDLVSNNFELKVRVQDYVGFVTCGHMSCPATILPPALALMSPSGGEVLQGGSEQEIRWLSNQSNGSVALKFSIDGGKTYPNVITTDEANDGCYNWIVPQLNSTQIKLQISLGNSEPVVDTSRDCLTIDSEAPVVVLLSPTGGEQFESGATVQILWQATDNFGLDKSKSVLLVSRDGGSSYPDEIARSIQSDSIYTWIIPDNWISDQMKIKMIVQDQAGKAGVAETPDYFSAAPISITLLSPNGGETLQGGAIWPIQWTSNFNVGTVDLFYSIDAGANYSNSIAQDIVNNGQYDWTIPPKVTSSSVLVKAQVHSLTSTEDLSDASFAIESGTTGLPDNRNNSVPKDYQLYQNYPNPFNPETQINFDLPKDSEVLICVYNTNGELVTELFRGKMTSGNYSVVWNADDMPSGMYMIYMVTESYVQMKKCILLK